MSGFGAGSVVALDIEIARPVHETGGWDRTSQMSVAVAVAYDLGADRYRVFDHAEGDALRACIAGAGKVVTFNGWLFDLPVIHGIDRPEWEGTEAARGLRPRSCDLLAGMRATLGKFCKGLTLGETAQRTIGAGKSGDGANAPDLFKAGKVGELVTYCMDDVLLTARLYRFARDYGFLVGPDGRAAKVSV